MLMSGPLSWAALLSIKRLLLKQHKHVRLQCACWQPLQHGATLCAQHRLPKATLLTQVRGAESVMDVIVTCCSSHGMFNSSL